VSNILVLHGPNLNLTGTREPEIYGSMTLAEIGDRIERHAATRGAQVRTIQSNHEGVLIDALHEAIGWADGCVFNPGAYTHYSYALRDAVASVRYPTVEVHLSTIAAREEFRTHSVIAAACAGQISGFGYRSYLFGVDAVLALLESGS
jgi:3-dehydroquinate dehydratase-2